MLARIRFRVSASACGDWGFFWHCCCSRLGVVAGYTDGVGAGCGLVCVGEAGYSTTGKSVIRCDCADKAWIVSSIDRDAGCDYAGGLARSYKRSPTPPRKPRVATTEARERRARACAGGRVPNPGTQSAGTGKQSCDNGQAAMCLSRLQQSEAGLPHMISHFLTCFPTFKMPQHVGQVAGRQTAWRCKTPEGLRDQAGKRAMPGFEVAF